MASRQVESRYITTPMYIRKNGEQGVRKRVVVYAAQLGKMTCEKNILIFMQLRFHEIVIKYSY